MNYHDKKRATLFRLWIFVLLNIIFRDLHELFRPGMISEMSKGIVNGTIITDEFMLIAGIFLEIPIAMVLVSGLLARRFNRIANMVVPILTLLFMVVNPPRDLDDWWFLSMATAALLAIVVIAWRWRAEAPRSLQAASKTTKTNEVAAMVHS